MVTLPRYDAEDLRGRYPGTKKGTPTEAGVPVAFRAQPVQCLQVVQPTLPHIGHLAACFSHMVQPGLPHFSHLAGMVLAQEARSRVPRAIGIRSSDFIWFLGVAGTPCPQFTR